MKDKKKMIKYEIGKNVKKSKRISFHEMEEYGMMADVGVDYTMSRSNSKNPAYRILYSNDGLIYGTYDHYDTVFQIFP